MGRKGFTVSLDALEKGFARVLMEVREGWRRQDEVVLCQSEVRDRKDQIFGHFELQLVERQQVELISQSELEGRQRGASFGERVRLKVR